AVLQNLDAIFKHIEADGYRVQQLVLDRMPRLIHALANRTSLFHVGDLCLKRRALLRRTIKDHMPNGEVVLVVQVQLHGSALDHAFRLYHVPHTVNSRGGGDAANDPALIDRKSTRLNSSHVKTPYAVFCWNK